VSGPLLRLARAERVKYGYAGYWDAAPLSWQMKTAVQLYPVGQCYRNGGFLCRVPIHRISSWYHPRPHTRTMLVVDPAQTAFGPVDAPPSLGKPERVVAIRPVTVYIYPYDIAARFG
jgi:hypothetical protein